MAIIVTTGNANTIVSSIKAFIDDGTIDTWEYDEDGDFTHTPNQWRQKAWFRARIEDGKITFHILTPTKTTMSRTTYAIYHGRFIEMLLTHFDEKFSRAVATALPVHGDNVRG